MRLRNNPKAKIELLNSNRLINLFPYKLNSNTIVELGMGKGEMLSQLAVYNPQNTYIGIEKFATVAYQAIKKANNLNLNNLYVICDDINRIDVMFNGKVNTIWLTFSDPWPKKRHCKRRLTHSNFLKMYQKILSKNGTIKLKTDNDGFFQYSLESLQAFPMKIIYQTKDLYKDPLIQNNFATEYEKKWNNRGKNINYLEAEFYD